MGVGRRKKEEEETGSDVPVVNVARATALNHLSVFYLVLQLGQQPWLVSVLQRGASHPYHLVVDIDDCEESKISFLLGR